MDKNTFNNWYLKHLKFFTHVLARLKNQISQMLHDNIVVCDKKVIEILGRVKEDISLYDKIEKKSITKEDEILARITDIVGICLVCKNLSDSTTALHILKNKAADFGIRVIKADHINRPDGYRAIHIDILVELNYDNTKRTIPCEIQIKTLAQNMWSILSHDEFYKTDLKGDLLSGIQSDIGAILGTIDTMSQRIRDQIESRAAKESDKQMAVKLGTTPTTTPLDENTLSQFLVDRWPDYEIDPLNIAYLTKELKDYSIETINDLNKLMEDEAVNSCFEGFLNESFHDYKNYEGIDPLLSEDQQLLLKAFIYFYGYDEGAKNMLSEKVVKMLNAEYCVSCGNIIHPNFLGSAWNEESGEYDRKGILIHQYRPEADWNSDYYCHRCFHENMRPCLRCGIYTDSGDFCSNCQDDIERD